MCYDLYEEKEKWKKNEKKIKKNKKEWKKFESTYHTKSIKFEETIPSEKNKYDTAS